MITEYQYQAAVSGAITLQGGPRSDYPGEQVEYLPREDVVNRHPDFYAWHVVGRPNYARLSWHQLTI